MKLYPATQFMRNVDPLTQMQSPYGLPSLAPQVPPTLTIDPRGYQPGYAPGGNSDPFSGFGFLSLGSVNETSISFGAALNKEQRPEPQILTLVPSASDMLFLWSKFALDNSLLTLHYKIQYVFDAGYPNYFDGLLDQPDLTPQLGTAPSMAPVLAAAPNTLGYKVLSQRGIRFLVRGWAMKVWIMGVGGGAGAPANNGSNWQTLGPGSTPVKLRIDAALTPATSVPGHLGNADPMSVGIASQFLPQFSRTLKVPAPNGAAPTFQFRRADEGVIVTYPASGVNEYPIPHDAFKIAASADGLHGETINF